MSPKSADPSQIGARRSRLGCLGCLVKGFIYLVGLLVLGSVLVLAIDAVFNPWSFYMGGSFHPIPMWAGWGEIHPSSGHDYALYVWFGPYQYAGKRGAQHYSGVPRVVGSGTLCTPRGERYDLHVTGNLEKHMGSSTDGKHMTLYVYRQPWYFTWVGTWDRRPALEFHGVWHNPDLVLDDHGSLDRAFNPDATVRSGLGLAQKPGEQGAQLTLHEGSKSQFEAACRQIQGH